MYGHSEALLASCHLCPAWAPRRATALDDDGLPVCTPHALTTISDLIGAQS